MPVLSEAGADRDDILNTARKFAIEFDEGGAAAITAVPPQNRNVKLNIVTEAFFYKGNKYYDYKNPEFYGKVDKQVNPTIKRIIDILKMPDSREVFGLTYRDLIDMDDETLTYISDIVYGMYKERLEIQREQEKSLNGK